MSDSAEKPAPSGRGTRDRILAAAFQLFLQHGYDGTGLSQILAASGLSKGAFYHYFATKDEVYREVVIAFFLTPLEGDDFAAIADRPLRDSRQALARAYDQLPEAVAAAGVDMARYFALFFEAISRLDDVRDAIRAYYANLLKSLAARTYAEHEMFPKVADAHARNIIARFEGNLFLAAVFGNQPLPAMDRPAGGPGKPADARD
jgi:AcrR family transcriptional regulator